MKATGVHTAFIDHIELLKEKNDLEVVVNDEGTGDVLHCHTYGLYFIWKGLRYKGRRVFTAHVIPDSIKGSLPAWKILMPFIRLGLKIVYSYADVCIAISPMVEKAIIETGAKTKIVKIYNPVHLNLWKRTEENRKKGRQMLGLADDKFVVLGAGQLIGRKGIEDFINISYFIPEAIFVWAGGRPFGGFTEGIARINNKLADASDNFKYAGPIDLNNMPYIYAAADLFLFPSYQENCPLAPIEAAASGIPVIFRDIDEYRSLYENYYLKARNSEEFVTLTRRMIHDSQYYNEGLEISDKLLTQFDKEIIRNKLIDIYQSLCDNYQSSVNQIVPQFAD
jgi:1,2-diacylglycerol-3-alpha-glucose alpha-1,2-galactosyltransferase